MLVLEHCAGSVANQHVERVVLIALALIALASLRGADANARKTMQRKKRGFMSVLDVERRSEA